MNGYSDREIIGGLIAELVASYMAFSAGSRQHQSSDRKIEALDAKLSARIDALDARLSTRLDALTIAVSRLEGAMWGRMPPQASRKVDS
jgi:hypothetical protein